MKRWLSTMTAFAVAVAMGSAATALAQAPKHGGVLNVMQREELPQGLSIHETSTIATVWPASPCFNNLVYFDPMKPAESVDTIVGELAERWSWQDGYRNLVFFLRKDVKWHDGQPFTSKDVKFTFDMVREAPDAQTKLRLNPRKDWYANVEAIEAADPYTVVFRLKRPQPSIMMMLASGQSPVYPAHVPLADQRNRCVGTGPFKFKEWRRGEFVEYVKNPDYFVKGRPYLDGLKYVIISERGTRTAAIQAGRLDVSGAGRDDEEHRRPAQGGRAEHGHHAGGIADLAEPARQPHAPAVQRRARAPGRRPGDRPGRLHQGRPAGRRGAGRGARAEAVRSRGASARRTSCRSSASPRGARPRRRSCSPRRGTAPAIRCGSRRRRGPSPTYVDLASYVVNELKQVGVEITVKPLDSVQWYGITTRKEFQLGINISGFGVDDPDAILFENYGCASSRNYTGYCDEGVGKLMDQQSQELDPKKRLALVHQIQKKLTEAGARPTVGWGIDHFAHWPHVKNLVPHNSLYNFGRMQEVWLDR